VLAIDHRTSLTSVWPLAATDPATAVVRLEATGTAP
jgi:hypothetical protein